MSEDSDMVHSGVNYNKPDIDSVLRLQDNWLRDGEVRFVYMVEGQQLLRQGHVAQVDGEDQFDGFRFIVDGATMMGPEYTTMDDDGNLVWKEVGSFAIWLATSNPGTGSCALGSGTTHVRMGLFKGYVGGLRLRSSLGTLDRAPWHPGC